MLTHYTEAIMPYYMYVYARTTDSYIRRFNTINQAIHANRMFGWGAVAIYDTDDNCVYEL